jgi:hypothetical protein
MRIKRDLDHPVAKSKGGLAAVKPPAENLDAEIDAMVEEIYEARENSKERKPVICGIA